MKQLSATLALLAAAASLCTAENTPPAELAPGLTCPSPQQADTLDACIENFLSKSDEASQRACLECARQLLAQDASCIHREDDEERSPLCQLVLLMGYVHPRGAELERYADFIALLLSHGADPLKPEGSSRIACAADHMAACAGGAVLPLLRERGFAVEAPAHVFTEKGLAEQLMEIPAAAIRTEEIAAAYELLASLLPPPGQSTVDLQRYERNHCLFSNHLPHLGSLVLPLLHRADAPRTQQLLRDILKEKSAWNEEHPVTLALFRNILLAKEPAYPTPLDVQELAELASHLEAGGQPRLAHALVRLMALAPSADSALESFCSEDTPLALQAAAWSCRLRRAGLPYLGSERAVYGWTEVLLPEDLGMTLIEPMRLVNAINGLCLSPEDTRLNMGNPYCLLFDHPYLRSLQQFRQQTEEGIAALRHIGAHKAAAHVAELLNTPETRQKSLLEPPSAASTEASLEAEAALGRYIWQHRDAIAAWQKEYNSRCHSFRHRVE